MMTIEKSIDSTSLAVDKLIAHNELLRKREIEHLKKIEELNNLLSDVNNFIDDVVAQKITNNIWRDIDKHPLPENAEPCRIDLKLDCGSALIDCVLYDSEYILFRGHMINHKAITQWRTIDD